MTNTAVLQFPSSYVLMDEEEMTYVDGGGNGADRKARQACLRAGYSKLTQAERNQLCKAGWVSVGVYVFFAAGMLPGVFAAAATAWGIYSVAVTAAGWIYGIATL